MSLTSQGDGWWQASDGLWYAPQQAPAPPPPIVAATPTPAVGPVGKIRNPWAILGLSIITLGIYFLYWWGTINSEIKRRDPFVGGEPALSVLAMVGSYFFVIFSWFSAYNTAVRIRRMQQDAGNANTISPGVALLLTILFGVGLPLYVGYVLRSHWRSVQAP